MNFFRLSFFLLLVVAMTACGKDDDGTVTCTQSDWVGTYEGTLDCDGTVEDVTVTITASGADAIIIVYETTTVTAEYDPLTPDACDLTATSSDIGISLTVDAALDGNKLAFSEVLTLGGSTSTCDITATRK